MSETATDAPENTGTTSEQAVETTQAAPESQTPERPEWLPEKFKSPEDMAKAYGELEKKLGQRTQADAPAQPTKDEPAAQPDTDTTDVKELVDNSALNPNQLETELLQNGELSEDTLKALKDAGMTDDMIAHYTDSVVDTLDRRLEQVFEVVGGEDQFNTMVDWAVANLPQDEIDNYNAILANGDTGAIRLAALGLNSLYTKANGQRPNLIQGQTSETGAQGYSSQAELQEAMRDPRYKTDEAYRSDVREKLKISPAHVRGY